MENLFQGKDIAPTQAFYALAISVEAESEQSLSSFLAAIKGREQGLVAAFLAFKAKEAPIGCNKFKDWLEADKGSAQIKKQGA